MWIVIAALAAAFIGACIGGYLYYREPRDSDPDDRYGDYAGYYDDDYFSDIQDAVREGDGGQMEGQQPLWETGQMPVVGTDLSDLPAKLTDADRAAVRAAFAPATEAKVSRWQGEHGPELVRFPDQSDDDMLDVEDPDGWIYEGPGAAKVRCEPTVTDHVRAIREIAAQYGYTPAQVGELPMELKASGLIEHEVRDEVAPKPEPPAVEDFTGQFEAIKDKQEHPELYVSSEEWLKQQEDELNLWRTQRAIELAKWRADHGLSDAA